MVKKLFYIFLGLLILAAFAYILWNYTKPVKSPDALPEEVKQAEQIYDESQMPKNAKM